MKHKRPESLEEQALAYVAENGAVSVPKLYDALRLKYPILTEADMTDLVWRLVEAGQADVEDLPPATNSLWQYLRFWERNLWFYGSLVASIITIVAIYVFPSEFPLVVLRWVFGSVFVLFIPGYVALEALFPKYRDLDWIERLALGVGLSLALVMLVGLLLNYTSWGIKLTPIVISLTILNVGLSVVALRRRFGISVEA